MLNWLRHIDPAARRRPKAEFLAAASVILVAWLGAWVFVRHQHVAELAEVTTRAETLARLFEESVTGRVKVIDNTLLLFRASEADGKPDIDVRTWGNIAEQRSPIFQIALLGPDGRLVKSNLETSPPGLDLSDREHFRFHADAPGRDVLFISRPVIGRVSQKLSIQFSRRIFGPDGRFAGVVVASVSPAFLTRIRDDMGEPGAIFTLIGGDGAVRALAPDPTPPWSVQEVRALADAVAVAAQATLLPSAAYRSVTTVRRIDDLDLIVAASLPEEHPSGSLSYSRRSAIACASAVSLLVIAGSIALAHRRRRLELSQRSLVASRKVLSDAMQNVSQGILLLDNEGRILVANAKAAGLIGVPQEALTGTPNLVDVTLTQYRAGEFGDRFASEQEVVDFIRSEWANLSRPHVYERIRSDGMVLEVRTNPLPDGGGCVRTYTDVTDRKAAEERARHLALHDTLTGLPNRALINERLNAAIGRGHFALLFIDLDHFKLVNDLYGHDAGDKLLIDVAARLRGIVRPGDTVGRLGGDEFTVMLPKATPAAASAAARRIVTLLSEPCEVADRAFSIGASVGIAMHPEDGSTATAMMAAADTAMYEAKRSGRGNYAVYDATMARGIEEQRNLESDLRVAVAERQFRLVFQPVRRTDTGAVTGFEALIRWHHPERGIVSPAMFIPAAEQGGLILPIGAWVLETACAEAVAWEGGQFVAVNMSPPQFLQPDLCAQVAAILHRAGLPASRLEIEVTEGLMLGNSDIVLRNMIELRQMGVRLSLDDFGTGHSSLTYLRRYPFDRIKIDRSFVQNMSVDAESRAIVASVLTLGRSLQMSVLAEGVETERQLDELRAMSCEQVQGYLLGRPMSPEAARALATASPAAGRAFVESDETA